MKALLFVFGLIAVVGVAAVIVVRAGSDEGLPANTDPTFEVLRLEQRLSNTLFEVVPGQVLPQGYSKGTTATPPGYRYDLKVRLRSFDQLRSLHLNFFDVEAQAWDAEGNVMPIGVYLPAWGGFRNPGASISPERDATSTILLFPEKELGTFWVEITYGEPGRSVEKVSFTWPYGR